MAHFYLIGFFDKGTKASFMISREKPFEINLKRGTIAAKCICVWPSRTRKPHNTWPKRWQYFDGGIKEIDNDPILRESINDTWEQWCHELNRKYSPILEK